MKKTILAAVSVACLLSQAALADSPGPVRIKGKRAAQLTALLKGGGIGAIESSVDNRSAMPAEITYTLGSFTCSSHRLGNQSDIVTAPSCSGAVNAQAWPMVLLLDQAEISQTPGAKSPEDRWRYDIEIKSIVCKLKTEDMIAVCDVQPADPQN